MHFITVPSQYLRIIVVTGILAMGQVSDLTKYIQYLLFCLKNHKIGMCANGIFLTFST